MTKTWKKKKKRIKSQTRSWLINIGIAIIVNGTKIK